MFRPFKVWLGAFLENHRKAQERRRLTLTRVAVLSVMLGESLRLGAGSHHDRDGVKGAIRALRVESLEYPGLWDRQHLVFEADQRGSRALGGLDTGYVRIRGPTEHDD